MEFKYIMIRYGEIGTKGKNKKNFIKCLYTNIKNAVAAWIAEKAYWKLALAIIAAAGVAAAIVAAMFRK